MKLSKFLPVLLVAVALTLSGAGCKKTPKNVTNIGPGSSTPPPGAGSVGNPIGGPSNTRPINSGLPLGNDGGARSTPISSNPISDNNLGDPSKTGGTALGGRPGDDMNEDRLTLAPQTVYFDYDKSSVRTAEQSKVESVATYLKNEPKAVLRIEGNCDERGTEEYNRALGERRALAVREYLLTLGVTADRITTLSYGEDKPASPGHDEAAWSQNRRGDFVILKAKQ